MLSGTAILILLIALTPLRGGVLALLLLFQVRVDGLKASSSLWCCPCRRAPPAAINRALSSACANGSAVHVDPGSANHGHDRRSLWRQCEFPDRWRSLAAALHLSRTDHPSDREAGVAERVARGRHRLIFAMTGQSPRNAPPDTFATPGKRESFERNVS